MGLLCAFTNLALELNPRLAEAENARPSGKRVCVLREARSWVLGDRRHRVGAARRAAGGVRPRRGATARLCEKLNPRLIEFQRLQYLLSIQRRWLANAKRKPIARNLLDYGELGTVRLPCEPVNLTVV